MSAKDDKGCRYRSDKGLKCAVGCLITDEAYEKYGRRIEGKDITHPAVQTALEHSGAPVGYWDLKLLQELQAMHDFMPVENWSARLEEIETEYYLKVANG